MQTCLKRLFDQSVGLHTDDVATAAQMLLTRMDGALIFVED